MRRYDPDNKKYLSSWFDPHDPRHVAAYWCVISGGKWPDWFVAEMERHEIVINDYWETLVQHKCMLAWIEYSRKENLGLG